MRKKYVGEHVMKRDDMFYYVRHIPRDLSEHYRVKRLCFSLKTKSLGYAIRVARSVSQRLEDYWFGIRFKRMDVPVIDSVRKENSESNESPTILDALDLYLKLKGQGKDKVFYRTATRNIEYVTKVLGNKSIKSYSSSDGAKFRDCSSVVRNRLRCSCFCISLDISLISSLNIIDINFDKALTVIHINVHKYGLER